MKTIRVVLLVLLAMALTISVALADPAPNFNAGAGNVCTGITITPAPGTTGTNFTYVLSVAPNATFNGVQLSGIRGLFVYVNGGNSFPTGPTSIVASIPGWSVDPYLASVGGFGYITPGPPSNFIQPGATNVQVGTATFAAPGPLNQVYLVHAVDVNGNSGFCQPGGGNGNGVIPEPGSMALLGMGLAPLAGIIRRRRK